MQQSTRKHNPRCAAVCSVASPHKSHYVSHPQSKEHARFSYSLRSVSFKPNRLFVCARFARDFTHCMRFYYNYQFD